MKKFFEMIKSYAWVSAVILSVAALGFSLYNLKLTKHAANNDQYSGNQNSIVTVDYDKFSAEPLLRDLPVLGDSSAPLTLYEFADFQCPYCKRFFDNTLAGLKSRYMDSGKLRLAFVNLPLRGQESRDAAEAAMCAKDQGQFWPYHDLLYKNQAPEENSGALNPKKFKSFAQTLNLDMKVFNECLSSHKNLDVVNAQQALADKYGAAVTPTFFLKDRIIIGAQPLEIFIKAIDEQLAK